MSRNLSINQIAPHITSASVPRVDTSNNIPAFSPYISRSQEQQTEEKTERDRAQTERSDPSSSKKQQDSKEPEIFKLIAVPDFSDFFALANGKNGAKMMYIIKNIRSQRGVTTSLPISNSRIYTQRDAYTYLKTDAQFIAPKGQQFIGKL